MSTDNPFSLEGKVAVVTGASSGMGSAIAEALAAAGAAVTISGRNAAALEQVARRIRVAGGRAHTVACDITADDAPTQLIDGTVAEFGKLDILVNNAGIFYPKPFEATTMADFDAQLNTNVRAPFAITQRAIPHLRGGGVVINITSIASHVAFINSSAYCASKGALELLTKALCTEFAAEGIRFCSIAPGNIHTPMNDHLFESPDYAQAMLEATPANRIGVVADIANAAVFLASPAADYVHGASLLVDGGWCAR